ncbi:MAG: hypothetical protein ATN31_01175 [Candidatus Epulonipiscioides saccharophilum]|nr:MAG: hypothetical protein ATN31_01175 [Epulopiscium sp. AS2M-Bin001]
MEKISQNKHLYQSRVVIILEEFEGFFKHDIYENISYQIPVSTHNPLADLILALDRELKGISEIYILAKTEKFSNTFQEQFQKLLIKHIQVAYHVLGKDIENNKIIILVQLVNLLAPQNVIILGRNLDLAKQIRTLSSNINTINIMNYTDIQANMRDMRDIETVINEQNLVVHTIKSLEIFPIGTIRKESVLVQGELPTYEKVVPIERNVLLEELNLKEDAILILMASNYLEYFMNDDFLKMCDKLIENNPKIYFVLVTDFIFEISQNKEHFKFIDNIDRATEVLPACNLFLSVATGWELTIAQFAIMADVPVIYIQSELLSSKELGTLQDVIMKPRVETVLLSELICANKGIAIDRIEELISNQQFYEEIMDKLRTTKYMIYKDKWSILLDILMGTRELEWTITTLRAKIYYNFIIQPNKSSLNEVLSFYNPKTDREEIINDVKKYLDGFPDLQSVILSARFNQDKNGRYLAEITKLLIEPNFTILNTYYIYYQVGIYSFCNACSGADYKIGYLVYKNLFERFLNTIDQTKYKPIVGNTGIVVVTCMHLLNRKTHAPTKQTLDYCYNIQKYLNKKVIIVVTDEPSYAEAGNIYTYNLINYEQPGTDKYLVMVEDEKFLVYQPILVDYCEQTMRDVVDFIYDWNPELVFNVGNRSLISDACKIFTKSISYQCGNGFGVTCSNVTVVPREPRPEEDAEQIEFFESNGQKVIYSPMTARLPISDKEFTREEYGIAEDAFVMCAVGGRLATEVTDEFTKIIEKILSKDKRLLFVFIGNFISYEDWVAKSEILTKQTKYVGFISEGMVNFYKICNLYVNPFRGGGGISAVEALYQGVPVVALSGGDAGVMAGKNFYVENKEDYIGLVEKYFTDPDFMQRQSNLAKLRAQKTFDTKSAMKKLLEDVDRVLG